MTPFPIGRPPAIVQLNAQQVQNDPGGSLGPWLLALVGITFMMVRISQNALAPRVARSLLNSETSIGHPGHSIDEIFLRVWLRRTAHVYAGGILYFAVDVVSRLTAFTSQLFFAYRCYLLYNRSKLVLGGLLLGMSTTLALFGVIGGALATAPFTSYLPKTLIIPALTINLATDIAIAGLTLWKLGARGKQAGSPKTENALRRLRNVTVEAAVPPAICAILNMITYLTLLNAPDHDGQTLSTGFEFADHRGSGFEVQQGDAGKSTVIIAAIPEAIHPTRASLASVDRRSAARSV
ncbi:hypothetical protein FRC04_004883 [Tulasnella sp. 424]|nr:hypothetical protein FRC04_004883 [Tulasnella sp. 424]